MHTCRDRIHRVPRVWSNRELSKFGALFAGDVVNVSAWKDEDKEGRTYRRYFPNARSYTITNFDADKRGYQGLPGELFLDLEKPLPARLVDAFDVVFNHTTLEHVYHFQTAFKNLCRMSRDIVILVVPFVQQMHAHYGDFWRFSPEAVNRLFLDQGLSVGYLSFNTQRRTSVYVFAIGTKLPHQWVAQFPFTVAYVDPQFTYLNEPYAGRNVIPPSLFTRLRAKLRRWLNTSGQAEHQSDSSSGTSGEVM